MKPIVLFVLVAAIPFAVVAANAKTVTQSAGTQERMTAGVAGPVASAETARKKAKSDAKAGAANQPAPTDDQVRTNATHNHPNGTNH